MFGKRKTETQMDIISRSSIEELLEKDWVWFYPWDFEHTEAVLNKCSEPKHYAKLHKWAFHCRQHPEHFDRKIVPENVLDVLYKKLCIAITSLLRDNTRTTNHQIELIKEIHSLLNSGWIDRENSSEMFMLQKRLEVEWFRLTASIFEMIKAKNPTSPEGYESLFSICKKDDPIILELAGEINRLS